MQTLDIEKYLNDIQATGWTQLIHDRDFHKDIDCLNSKDKLYHLTLHIGKYAPFIVDRDTATVNYKLLADMFIITTSLANAMRVGVRDIWSSILNERIPTTDRPSIKRETLYCDVTSYLMISVSRLCKVCESLDHLESVNPHQVAMEAIDRNYYMLFTIWTKVLGKDFNDLLRLVCRRLLAVEMKHPFYKRIKREQARVAEEIAIREYVELPMHENIVLKNLSGDDCKMYNTFAMSTEQMVMAAPALFSLESKKLIMREMSGLYSLTALGKGALTEII
jgi:hypothetical protein